MTRLRLLLLAVTSAPMFVHAQPAHVAAAVTDADAAVPPPQYQSAYAGYLRAEELSVSPDKVWVQANREVSGQPEQDAKAPVPAPAAPPSAVPGVPAKDAPADPHAGHHMNKKGQ
nr:hypothetical protein [uncultured Duganella sp.]